MWKIYYFNGEPTNYECDENGSVRNRTTKRILKGRKKSIGYIEYELYINNVGVFLLGHRIVAQTFLPNPNNYPIVNHIDGNKENNHVSNLEWCDAKHNNQHAWDTGLNTDDSVALEVIQYNLKGEEINRFHSIAEAKRVTGICKVREAAFGSRNTAGGFIWKLANADYQIRDLGKKKPVQQFDMKGNLLASFESASRAARETGCARKGISDCCNGLIKYSHGFIWKFL
mgnify:FL=1